MTQVTAFGLWECLGRFDTRSDPVSGTERDRSRVHFVAMASEERPNEAAGDDGAPNSGDEEARPADANDEAPDVQPVPDKIGEGGTNLRDREAALERRRGGTEPSS